MPICIESSFPTPSAYPDESIDATFDYAIKDYLVHENIDIDSLPSKLRR